MGTLQKMIQGVQEILTQGLADGTILEGSEEYNTLMVQMKGYETEIISLKSN